MKLLLLSLLWIVAAGVRADSQVFDNIFWINQAQKQGLSVDLLYALALKESGRYLPETKDVRPWPYAIGVNISRRHKIAKRQTFYPETKGEAKVILQQWLDAGVTNIDIGLTQVNYHYHGDKVSSPFDLLDPNTNIDVGAQWLRNCQLSFGEVQHALSCYNTGKISDIGLTYANDIIRIASSDQVTRRFSLLDIDVSNWEVITANNAAGPSMSEIFQAYSSMLTKRSRVQ